MGLRPSAARWFEVLTPADELARAAEVLARTGTVEIEAERSIERSPDDPRAELEDARKLMQRWARHLPEPDFRSRSQRGAPRAILKAAIAALEGWGRAAEPLVRDIERLEARRIDLELLSELGAHAPDALARAGRMADAGPRSAARLFVLERGRPIPRLPGVTESIETDRHVFVAVLAPARELAEAERAVAESEIRSVAFDREASTDAIAARLRATEAELGELRARIDALSIEHAIPPLVASVARLDWFLTHVPPLDHTRHFALVTGWTSEPEALGRALDEAGVNALVRFPSAKSDPPIVLANPPWAKPFEALARLLGSPSRNEADPTVVLVIVAPLLFGFMFADVGQGAVLVLLGLVLRKKRPALAMLVPGGIAAIAFGLLFGSVFGREDLVPALWMHPLGAPIDVLGASVLLGAGVLTLGFVLSAIEAQWRRELGGWLLCDGALFVVYAGLFASLVTIYGFAAAALGATIFVAGHAIEKKKPSAVFAGLGELVERGIQLGVNTVSFARVGAFALAHAGLSLAIVELSHASGRAAIVVLALGNVVAIVLEGLVVGIQTTRLVLFEFFARFLRAEGRVFVPLVPPASNGSTGGPR
jgi:V/A-type H+-transporting ATPase subunit I